MALQKVHVFKDDSGHNYVIPSDMVEKWNQKMQWAVDDDEWDDFEDSFGKYRTGGDINEVQLYAELKD